MPEKETNQILVAEREQTVYMQLIGRLTFKLAADFKHFVLEQFDKNKFGILIDLSLCESIDSTFIGTITSLSLRFQKENKKFIRLLNVNAHVRKILQTLGLINFLDIVDEQPDQIDYKNLPISPIGKIETTHLMLDAHETLSSLNEKNALEFKDVVTYLQEQISDK